MTRHNRTIRTAIAAAVLFGQVAVSAPFAGAALQAAPDAEGFAAPSTPDAARAPRRATALPDVDARLDPVSGEINALTSLKAPRRDTSAAVAALRASLPGDPAALAVTLHPSGLAKQIVSLDGMLTGRSAAAPDRVARDFLGQNAALFGLEAGDVDALRVTMQNYDDTIGITFLKYEQTAGGVAVFNSEISIAVSPMGEVVTATAGQLVSTAQVTKAAAMSQDEAIVRAFGHCGAEISPAALVESATKSDVGLSAYANPLGAGRSDVLAGPAVVNVNGAARSAYHVYVDKGPSEWYETLVDASTGELLYRAGLYAHNRGTVFTESPDAGPRVLRPFGPDTTRFPGVSPGDIWQDGRISTGNNVDAYVDADGNNVPDTRAITGLSNGRAFASADGDFTFRFEGVNRPALVKPASVANLYYYANTMHDWMYSLGFTESARNFQLANFARGGAENDFVRAETQDGSGSNNANFATPPDGQSPRMQMFLFTMGTITHTDDRDSSLEADVVYHEYGHGVSNRLIGNGSGLTGVQSKAMGEGWSDYWALAANPDGVMGEFVTRNATSGIRRSPYDGRTTAPNGTYAMVGVGGFEVHKDGEVWCQTLVDLRRQLGGARTDRLVLAAMKVTPVSPSMLNARDAIIAANGALFKGTDACVIRAVFARHGMGVSATGNDGTLHTAAFDVPLSCQGANIPGLPPER